MLVAELNPNWDCPTRIIHVRFCVHDGLKSDIKPCLPATIVVSFRPKHAFLISGSRFLACFVGAPLVAEPRRRIAGDRRAMAEPGSVE